MTLGLRQLAIVTAFLLLWLFGYGSYADDNPTQVSADANLMAKVRTTVGKIHSYIFLVHTQGLTPTEKCEVGVELFDFSKWLALPIGTPVSQVCAHSGFNQMIGEIADVLVQKPKLLIDQYAGELLGTKDGMLGLMKGHEYVQLKHYILAMQMRPLDFAILGEPKRVNENGSQRINVPIQLASGLINKLDELKIEPKAAAKLREMAFAQYTMKPGQGSNLRLERIDLPNLTLKMANR